MAINVKFLKGTEEAYNALSPKDSNTFYYTGTNLYLGEVKLSNATDIQAAVSDLSGVKTDIGNLKNAVGTLTGLETSAKTDLVSAINEVLDKIDDSKEDLTVTVTPSTSSDYAQVYTIKQGDTTVGTINIPKDMVVTSGKVEKDPSGQDPGTYIVLTIANGDTLYIPATSLVDIYTAAQSAAKVQLSISNNNEISATIVAGSIEAADLAANAVITAKIADGNVTKAKLETSVQTSLGKADTAVQEVKESATNGNITVDGKEVKVHGLGSAAYTESTAYDEKGAAAAVLGTNTDVDTANTVYGAKAYAKKYADGLAGNYDAAGAADGVKSELTTYIDNALTWGTI